MPITINANEFAEPDPVPPFDPAEANNELDEYMDRQRHHTNIGGIRYSPDITQTTTRELDPGGW